MNIDDIYPSLSDLKKRAKSRLPFFAWEYLDSATGVEDQKNRNREELNKILFETRILKGEYVPNQKTTFLGKTYSHPFGVAPVGMSGMIWPGAEYILARGCAKAKIPYCLSAVATVTPEMISSSIGDMGWMQLYPPTDADVRRDMLLRAKNAGFHTLVLTVDVPAPSRRERQRRAQLTIPPKITPKMLWETATHPSWALGTAKYGQPRLRFAESYVKVKGNTSSTAHPGYIIRGKPDWKYLSELRNEWDGHIIVKGITSAHDALELKKAGVDAVWVSNHSGRQFDGGQSSIETLPKIRKAVGNDFPLIFDSGVEGGLDILRAIALGANFVMLGRAFHYALGALGKKGFEQMAFILSDDINTNMYQMGIKELTDSTNRLIKRD
ncbi:alpha-hydroxy-acid oxidizing protein [Amylibacter sp.]|nr:alpha-hydroxy-acid oxidizing protein [Amylibacter sp.]MDB4145663.1 alpha-hydroxy-acid oxidizing protein [Amylibacter sp.]MDB4188179.1 alpha-hydroxy-acid oxidizing protein [bacterium]